MCSHAAIWQWTIVAWWCHYCIILLILLVKLIYQGLEPPMVLWQLWWSKPLLYSLLWIMQDQGTYMHPYVTGKASALCTCWLEVAHVARSRTLPLTKTSFYPVLCQWTLRIPGVTIPRADESQKAVAIKVSASMNSSYSEPLGIQFYLCIRESLIIWANRMAGFGVTIAILHTMACLPRSIAPPKLQWLRNCNR